MVQENHKIVERWGSATLGGGVVDPIKQALPHVLSHQMWSFCVKVCIRMNRREPIKLGSAAWDGRSGRPMCYPAERDPAFKSGNMNRGEPQILENAAALPVRPRSDGTVGRL